MIHAATYEGFEVRDPTDEDEYLQLLDWIQVQNSRERRMWILTIRKAVHDYVMTRHARSLRKRRLHAEVKRWLFSNNTDRFNSYMSVCMAYDLDPEKWRRQAKTMSPGHMRRIELLGRRKSSGARV